MLPINVLTDLVRSYTTQAQSVVPQFLAMSFEMLRDGQSKIMENLTHLPNPMASLPGFEAMQHQQQAFMRTMMAGWPAASTGAESEATPAADNSRELQQIRKQLADLQAKLAKL